MKMSRRGMFGAAAGAVAAGPSAMRDAFEGLQTVAKSSPEPYYGAADSATNCKLARDPNWERDNLAKLKRIAAGDISAADKNYPCEGPQCPFVPLKSTSDAARWFLRARREEQRWEERTIKSALDALDQYDKTGILRTFF